jgi:kumamolisin
VVEVGPASGRPPAPLETLEAMMSVEWAGALAPGARIVAYFVDPAVMGDPWSAFLLAVIGGAEAAPTVASISWVTPERKYFRLHGRTVVEGLLDQAAALGITVVAASGDWGAFDGVPKVVRDGRVVSDAPWPHGVFPAVEERILGVGGTMITTRSPLTEVGWSGPLPPLGQVLPLQLVASSGGFSEDIPIPSWQRDALRAFYPRGASLPAVVPYGRGFPDVAFMAAGPAIQREPGNPLTAEGYQALANGQWVDFAGGTSLAAPIWAATIALANQARRARGLPRLGFANPLLYRMKVNDPSPFREITEGAADVAMYAVNLHGRAAIYRLPGYECCPGWNPVTGLGVPVVSRLIQQLCEVDGPRREA